MKLFVGSFLWLILFAIFLNVESKKVRWTSASKTKWSNRTVYEFKNIKYGAYSTGSRRFLPTNELENTIENPLEEIESEIPLHLSIYTTNRKASYPVMVYLSGYDLVSKKADRASPGYLLEKDVVLISVKYRNGALGFLSTLTNEIPGNTAISDIIAALYWIQQNVKKFGGDPGHVTLFGQYKAAGLIHAITLSELGNDLFHQVIYQSGSALLSNFTTTDPLQYSREVGQVLQCPNITEISELNACLIETDIRDLKKAFSYVWNQHKRNIPFITIGGPSNFLNRSPDEIHRAGQFRFYPKMLGFVDQPSSYFLDVLDPSPQSFFNLDRYRNDAGKIIQLSTEAFGRTPLANMIPNSTYAELKNANKEVLKSTFNLLVTSILDWSNFYVKSAIYYTGFLNKTPKTYAYAFKYNGQFHSLSRKDDNLLNDVTIMDDNLYLFDRTDLKLNADDTRMAKLMVNLWTSFAENGRPRDEQIENWPEVKPGSDQYLSIDRDITLQRDYTSEFQSAVNSFLEDDDENLFKA